MILSLFTTLIYGTVKAATVEVIQTDRWEDKLEMKAHELSKTNHLNKSEYLFALNVSETLAFAVF